MSRSPRGPDKPPTETAREAVPRGRGKGRSTAEKVVAVARSLPPAQPGARAGADSGPSDYSVTSRIERLPSETTPAPLPPSPAADAADVWFDQVPTNPAAVPDLDSMGGSRSDLAAAVARAQAQQPRDREAWAPPSALYAASGRVPIARRPWVLPVLIAATALTVGMVLGALIFGGGGSKAAAPCEKTPAAPSAPR